MPDTPFTGSSDELTAENGTHAGVHISSLHEGVPAHPDIPSEREKEPIENDMIRYAHEHADCGYSIYIEPGVVVETPLNTTIRLSDSGYSVHRNVIVLGAGARATLFSQRSWSTTRTSSPGSR
jgi:Fe-S cluster assembly scaffold protein SufB